MSYIRGDYYTWVSSDGEGDDDDPAHERIYISSPEVYCRDHEENLAEAHNHDAGTDAGRRGWRTPVWAILPMVVFDELVAMRHAELEAEGRLEEAEQRAIAQWTGNGGCEALRVKRGAPSWSELHHQTEIHVSTPEPQETNLQPDHEKMIAHLREAYEQLAMARNHAMIASDDPAYAGIAREIAVVKAALQNVREATRTVGPRSLLPG